MENRTEINIEDKIAVWKSALLTNPTLTEDNADELESHLLDEMASLQELGLTDNESFMIAENRMGSLSNLTKEFGKVNRNVLLRTRILPYLTGILVFIAFMSVVELFTITSILATDQLGISASYLNLVSITFLIGLSAGLVSFIYFRYKKDRLNIKGLKNIPLLAAAIITSKALIFLSVPFMTRTIELSNYGILKMNLNVFNLLFLFAVLITSCIVYYSKRKENKLGIV